MMSWRRLNTVRDHYTPRRCGVVTAPATAQWYGFAAVNPAAGRCGRSAFRHHPEHRLGISPAGLLEKRLHGIDEGIVLAPGQFDDLAASRLDRLARMLVLLHRQAALIDGGSGHGLAHRLLHVARPGVVAGAMQEDRARNIEMRRQRVELVESVHAVG